MAKGNFNKVILIGRLGQEPECKVHEGGWTSARFSMATEHAYKKKGASEFTVETDWHNVDAINSEFVQKWIKKGSLVMVEGRLTSKKYTARDGSEKYYHFVKGRVSLIADGIDNRASAPPAANQAAAAATPHVPETNSEYPEDDLPF